MSNFQQIINEFNPVLPIAIGFSGGADSTALLLACAKKWPGQVLAIHIHHGLDDDNADDFVIHCEKFCNQINVPLIISKVDGRKKTGQSPEDAARIARYNSFNEIIQDNNTKKMMNSMSITSFALAHHADDQIETLLLSLSRGAGLPGLSAMPEVFSHEGVNYYRPLLSIEGDQLRQWLIDQDVIWMDDPSNNDQKYTRNKIRLNLLPVLDHIFPQFRKTFSRSAMHAANAQECLDDLAKIDFEKIGFEPDIYHLQELSQSRQSNVIRYWLKEKYNTCPSTAQMAQLLTQVNGCKNKTAKIHLKIGSGYISKNNNKLHWCK